jgi:hypothetical protein
VSPAYTITAVNDQVRDWQSQQGGPMKGYRVTLRNADGREMANVEWSRKANSPAPQVGQTVDGTVDTSGQYGPKFKAAMAGGGGGGFSRSKSPEERRSIAMQASQKVAVEIVRMNAPPDVSAVTDEVLRVAQSLFQQVQRAEAGQ